MFYTKMGKFDFSGVANGGGHAVYIREIEGIAVPPRNLIKIDFNKVIELQNWSKELKAKFASSESEFD